jgi:hypothetical protein
MYGHVLACSRDFACICMCLFFGKRLRVYLHALRAGHVSACISSYQELGMYLNVSARFRGFACICKCLHVVCISEVHALRAGHISKCVIT